MNKIYKKILLLTLFFNTTIKTISIVYNFRIAQITKQPFVISNNHIQKPHIATGLMFNQFEKKYTGDILDRFTGGLAAFVYNFEPSCYIRTDFAVANIHQKICDKTVFTDTETDDLLITFGHNFTPTNKLRLTCSGLLGIPTHPIYALQHVGLGYGQIGTGLQVDGIYTFNTHFKMLCGTRYLYFVPQKAKDDFNHSYTFSIGNVGDILLALQYNWHTNHSLEGGYAVRWDFGASVCPKFDFILEKTNYTRNGFYLVYKYHFKTKKVLHRLLFDIGYASDSKSKIYGNKYIATNWISWTVTF